MPEILSKREAIAYLGLEEKVFENYFKNANEFCCLARPNNRGLFKFEKRVLDQWLQERSSRVISLDVEDYKLCLDFALAQHFRGYVLSDWGTSRQREFGQKMTNWIKGQLAEVAVKKYIKTQFGVDVVLDFQIHDSIVPQDIVGVMEKGKIRQPRVGVGIKASKPKSAYLVLSEVEVGNVDRSSDVYVFCRPEIPDDHILRITKDIIIELVKDQPLFDTYKTKIPHFEPIKCEIAGFAYKGELELTSSIPGQEFDGLRYVKRTGDLHRKRADWAQLISKV